MNSTPAASAVSIPSTPDMSNHHGAVPIRREITMRRRPGPQPPEPTHEQLFREAFMHALAGCCSQFETTPFVNRKAHFCEGDDELNRARQLVRRAWNVAVYSTGMFEQEREVDQFNADVKGFKGGG
jgi:hypothetical protein